MRLHTANRKRKRRERRQLFARNLVRKLGYAMLATAFKIKHEILIRRPLSAKPGGIVFSGIPTDGDIVRPGAFKFVRREIIIPNHGSTRG